MSAVLECLKGDILTGVVFLTQVAICGLSPTAKGFSDIGPMLDSSPARDTGCCPPPAPPAADV